jgi:hypothetical protein
MNKRCSFSRPDRSIPALAATFKLCVSRFKPAGRALLTALALAGLLLAPALRAQTTAQLTGTVEDPSGGVIPGAQVTLLNQATHDTRVAVTNSVGLYSFPALPPSSYAVSVTAKGFQPKQLTGIVLHAGDHISAPALVLTVGSETQTVQVQAAPQIIPVNNGERSAVLDSKQIENLALQGRDATELLKVLPGATTQSGGLTNAAPMFNDLNISANESAVGLGLNLNGVPNRGGTELLSDGVDVLDPGDEGGSISMINPSMTQEISVQTSNFGAESAHGPVVVSAISKSGSANYHGEAYFVARNDALNANDWQDNHVGTPKGSAHYYYPGGNFGGPVPGTHKKLLFWGGFERFLQNQGNANVLSSFIPSPEMMAGDFTMDNPDNQKLCPNGFTPNPNGKYPNGAWCQDLSGTALPDGSTVTNGHVPAQFLDPGAAALASFWPKANIDPATSPNNVNYRQPITNINNGWIYRVRVDYNLSDKTKLFVSYQQAYSAELAQGNGAHIYWTPGNSIPMPGGGLYGKVYTKALSGHFTHIFNPTTTNEFIAAWGFGNFPFAPPDVSAMYKSTLGYPAGYGTVFGGGSKFIPSYSTAGNFTFPDFSQSDIFEPGGFYLVRKEVPSFADNFTKVWGAHTVKLGFYTQNTGNLQGNDGTNLNGHISSFSGQNPDVLTGQQLGSNNPVANFIMGVVTGYQESNKAPVSDMAYQATAVYAQDSWRATNRLNLDFGARFEHVGHWYDRQGTGMAVFFPDRVQSDFNSGKIDPGYYWHGIDPGIPLSGQPNRFLFVSPRFGLAYDVFGTGNTVVRGGFGAYRFTGQYNDYAAALTTAQTVQNYSLPGQKTVLLSQIGPALLSTGSASNVNGNGNPCPNPAVPCMTGGQNGLDANDYGEPLTYAYNFTIDHRLPWNSLLDVAYVGNSTSQLLDVSESIEGSDFNAFADQNKTPIGAFFQPDPVTGNASSTNPENQAQNADGTQTGNRVADYHPFGYAYGNNTVVMAKSQSYTNYNGLQVTWLKSQGRLTYNFNFTWSKTLGTGLQNNPYVMKYNYGPESIDRPYVFNASYTYQTGHFNHGNALVRGALGGWTISGISTWQAGGYLPSLLGNGVPNFGFSAGYDQATLPANAKDLGIGKGISQATYYGTDEGGLAIQPVLTCNPNEGLAKYQRVQLKCFAPPKFGQFGGQNYPYMSMGSYFNNDLALYKSFHIHENQQVQFRISAFNWLNHPLPEFSSQSRVSLSYLVDYNTKTFTNTTPSTFGYMDTKSQAPYSRILELNVKYSF